MKTPDEVLRALCMTVANGTVEELAAIATEHQKAIHEHFEGWADGVSRMGDHPAEMQALSLALELIAELFDANGVPDLLQILARRGGDEPIH